MLVALEAIDLLGAADGGSTSRSREYRSGFWRPTVTNRAEGPPRQIDGLGCVLPLFPT